MLPRVRFVERVLLPHLRRLSPAVRARTAEALRALPDVEPLRDEFEGAEDELCLVPEVRELAFALLDPSQPVEVRKLACVMLTAFPGEETVARLAAVLADDGAPQPVRNQAAWTLSYRQQQDRPLALYWPPAAVAAADAAVLRAWEAGLWRTLDQLPAGTRHVFAPEVHAALERTATGSAEGLAAAAKAVESVCAPPLAAVLFERLREIGDEDAPRIIPALARALGPGCVPALLAYAKQAPWAERSEAHFAALALDPEAARADVEAFRKGLTFSRLVDARIAWHRANPGRFPVLDGLAFGRTSATFAPAERPARAAEACRNLAALAECDGLVVDAAKDFWAWSALIAADVAPEELVRCVETRPEALDLPLLNDYLLALGRLGRLEKLAEVALQHDAMGMATLLLARFGRPFLALRARARASKASVEAVAGEALALFLAGRVDLANLALAAKPEPRPIAKKLVLWAFPGPDELWRVNRAPLAHPVLRAVVEEDVTPLLGLCEQPRAGAEPDVFDFALLASAQARLSHSLAGRSVFVTPWLAAQPAVRARLEELGARLVSAPFKGTELYLADYRADPKLIAKLEQLGATRLPISAVFPPHELKGTVMSVGLTKPWRVTFLCPDLTLPAGKEGLKVFAEDLLHQTIFEHLLRHPVVSMSDPADSPTHGEDGLRYGLGGEHDGAILQHELGDNRRDEVLWFEATLDAGRTKVVLHARDAYGRDATFPAIGENTLSGLVSKCLRLWLEARRIPDAERPLESVTVDEFLAVAAVIAEVVTAFDESDEGRTLELVGKLRKLEIPALELLTEKLPFGPWYAPMKNRVLELDTEHPGVTRDVFLERLQEKGDDDDRALMLDVAERAPMWGKPHLSIHGKKVKKELRLRHAATAAQLIPANTFALEAYANELYETTRLPEAFRYYDQAARLQPRLVHAHQYAHIALARAGRYGSAFRDIEERWKYLGAWWDSGEHDREDRNWLRGTMFLRAEAYEDVGRLGEAAELFQAAIDECTDPGDDRLEKMRELREDPETFACAYAREGHYRGDPGRVLEGFGKGYASNGSEFAMLADALVALGREEQLPLAWAHYHGGDLAGGSLARLAAARGLLLQGRVAEALELVHASLLSEPGYRLEGEVHRALRLGATQPLAAWEQAISERLAQGAPSVARWYARDAADFVPGASESAVVKQALGAGASLAFDAAWLAPLRSAVGALANPIDAFFAAHTTADLASSDRLVNGWLGLLAPAEEGEQRGRQAAYVFAQAAVRYLALASGPGNVLAGGLRQVAWEALEALRVAPLDEALLVPAFAALEAVSAAGCDERLLDLQLLRIEWALQLDRRYGGHLAPVFAGLRAVPALYRGDEQVAAELNRAYALREDPANAAEAVTLFERCARAVGKFVWAERAEAGEQALAPRDFLDAHWVAALASPTKGGPWVELAKVLLGRGKPDLAQEALCRGLPLGGDKWRKKQLDELKPLLAQAKLPVPLDWAKASTQGSQALQSGDFETAVRCLRWCRAIDAENETLNRNLGIAYARLGRAEEALAVFAANEVESAPRWAGQALFEAGKHAEAVAVFRYGATYGFDADGWKLMGTSAWYLEDDEAAAMAFAALDRERGGALDENELNSWLTALNAIGEFARAEEVAKRLLERASDATYTSCGQHGLAKALLGQGKGRDALGPAQQAVKLNPLPDNQKEFAETLAKAKAGEAITGKPTRGASAHGRMYAALEASDFDGAKAAAEALLAKDPRDAAALRVLLAVARHRTDRDRAGFTALGAEVAASVLVQAAGASDAALALTRAAALRTREDFYFPADAAVELGLQVSREKFEARFAELSSGVGGEEQEGEEDEQAAPDEAAIAAAQQAAAALAGAAAGGGDADPVVFPGAKVAKLSDYVKLMKAMQSGNPMGALAQLGIDMASYGQIAMQWGQKLATDPTLTAKFAQLMAR